MPIKRDKRWNEFRAALTKQVRDAVARSGIIVQNEIKTGFRHASNVSNGGVASPAGSPPGVDTGTLRRSIQIDVSRLNDATRPRVRIGSNLRYARIHEFGGVITSKSGYLTIPLTQEAKLLRRRTRNLRALNLVPFRSRKGSMLLGRPAGRGKARTLKPLFLLRKSVRIPARPWIRPALRRARPKILAEFQAKSLLRDIRLRGPR